MRLSRWLCLLALLLLAGCAGEQKIIGGKKPPKLYDKVVSLSPGCTEIASATFARIIAGRTASCNMPERVKEAPIVMKGVKPDYEKIASLKPDVVLYDPELFAESDIAKFKELGIPTMPIGGNTIDEFIDTIYEFGRHTGSEELGSKLVDQIEQTRINALASPPNPPVTVTLVLPGVGTEHMAAGTESFWADVVKAGGGKPVGPSGTKYVPISAEWLLKADPELIVTAGAPDPILKDPRLASLRAVKKKHVYGTNPDIVLRRGNYVDKYIKRISELVNIVRR